MLISIFVDQSHAFFEVYLLFTLFQVINDAKCEGFIADHVLLLVEAMVRICCIQ